MAFSKNVAIYGLFKMPGIKYVFLCNFSSVPCLLSIRLYKRCLKLAIVCVNNSLCQYLHSMRKDMIFLTNISSYGSHFLLSIFSSICSSLNFNSLFSFKIFYFTFNIFYFIRTLNSKQTTYIFYK